MPGFNQRGPMNEGPMTGRGQGICTGNQPMNQGFGMGMGRRRGQRGRQAPGWGPRFGQGFTAPVVDTQNTLKNRKEMLEAELAAIERQISDLNE